MPPLPAVAKALKIDMIFDDEVNFDIVTRFFAQYAGTPPSAPELDTFAQAVWGAWDDSLVSLTPVNVGLDQVEVTDLTSDVAPVGNYVQRDAGTRAGDPVSIGTAMVVSYEIARRYRGGHPRGYWPEGVSLDLGTLQTWTVDFVTEAQAQHDGFWAAVSDAGWSGAGTITPINISYFSGFTVVTNPTTGRARNVPTLRGAPVVDAITARRCRTKVGTQRRRLQYG